jgi:hypothetical protein
MSDTVPPQQPVRFDKSFTPGIDTYIQECVAANTKPTVKGFAKRVGCDVHDLWAWASKKKKDEAGQLTDALARPNFNAALTKLDKLEKSEEEVKLTTKQELFCQLYASDREFFGNGVQSYIEAYEPDQSKPNWYNVARASASQLLANINVCNRINELLEDGGLNDSFVDKQLYFVIAQHEDKSSKVAAIREYNKLKTRIIDRIDHTTKGKEMPQPIYGGRAKKTI